MNKEFDLFASSESDNLQEELANHSYQWTNKVTWVLLGALIFVAGISSGVWYTHKTNSLSNAPSGGIAANFASQRGGQGNSNASGGNSIGTQPSGGQGFGGGGFGRGTAGTIKKIDGTTIELETRDGSTITVKAQSDTRVLSTSSDSFASLKVGDSISVLGQTESDGTITPNAITKGGGFGNGGGGGNRMDAPTTTPTDSSQPMNNSPTAAQKAQSNRKNQKQNTNARKKKTASGANSPNQNSPAPSITGAPPQGQSGQGPGGNGPGRGGRLNSPEFQACLKDEGVTIEPGQRPDIQDPQVATALSKCREKLGLGNGFGGGGPGNQTPSN